MSAEDAELNALENALRDLSPRSAVSRDAVLFAAGRASVRPRGWWPHACAGLALAVVVLSGWHAFRPDPAPQVRYVAVPVAVEPPPLSGYEPAPPDHGDYLRRRDLVLQHGVESLPPSPPVRTEGTILTPASGFAID